MQGDTVMLHIKSSTDLCNHYDELSALRYKNGELISTTKVGGEGLKNGTL